MIPSIPSLATAALLCACFAQAQDTSLVGTWTSKSRKVLTGPGFYNPVEDRLIEPSLTGISYSFTSDGWFEEAYYRAISNPTNPSCPGGILQWQHGVYSLPGNGSIILEPIAVDGRQLTSSCQYENAVYERWSQVELIQRYEVITDPFHNVPRLNLFRFDGSPQQPLYLEMSPPQMLPTQTLNPTATASATGTSKSKRDAQEPLLQEPLNKGAIRAPVEPYDADKFWWAGVGLIAVGSAMYMYPSSK